MMDDTLGCIYLSWGTDDEVDPNSTQDTDNLEQGGINVETLSGMELLQAQEGCLKELKGNRAIESFTKIVLWLLRCFYLNRFHSGF